MFKFAIDDLCQELNLISLQQVDCGARHIYIMKYQLMNQKCIPVLCIIEKNMVM